MSATKAFDQWKKNFNVCRHEDGCVNKNLAYTPINECSCDCYEKAIFFAGYNAAKGEATKPDKNGKLP